MVRFPEAFDRLIRELTKLPSIGEKSATRLAYYLIQNDRKLAQSLARVLEEAAQKVKLCAECFYLTDETLCPICKDPLRDRSIICIVEKPMDLTAIERVREYKGLYHVLHGLWAPLRGQGPESMTLEPLLRRVKDLGVKEAILATSSTVEGDATALYVAHLLSERSVKVTRLAQGIPKGGELEYADDLTLSKALAGRNVING